MDWGCGKVSAYNVPHSQDPVIMFVVQITRICKDEVVCLPVSVSRYLNHMSQVAVCTRISGESHFGR